MLNKDKLLTTAIGLGIIWSIVTEVLWDIVVFCIVILAVVLVFG